jgi:recombinational DNA repair protein (RecF pathway)
MSTQTTPSTETSGISGAAKHCVKCGRDVNGRKRMKDSQGRYWCYECGANDEAQKGNTLMTSCAGCGKPTSPTHLYKVGEQYFCPNCRDDGKARKRGGRGGGGDEARKEKIKLAVAAVAGLGGVALIVGYLMDALPF